MAHAASRRRGLAGNESDDRFGNVLFRECRSFFFRGAADLAYHDDAISIFVFLKEFQSIDVCCADNRIAADANRSRLPKTERCKLPYRFDSISVSPTLRHVPSAGFTRIIPILHLQVNIPDSLDQSAAWFFARYSFTFTMSSVGILRNADYDRNSQSLFHDASPDIPVGLNPERLPSVFTASRIVQTECLRAYFRLCWSFARPTFVVLTPVLCGPFLLSVMLARPKRDLSTSTLFAN